MKKKFPLLLAAFVIAAATVYLHNGPCFACDGYATTDNCTKHLGPCTTQNAKLLSDKCQSNSCPNCNTCDSTYTFTCCYYAQYECMDDANLGRVMYDYSCKSDCQQATASGGQYDGGGDPGWGTLDGDTFGDQCPGNMLCY
jgi:hypothetical protein